MLLRVLINEGTAAHREPFNPGWQRHRADYPRTGSFSRLDNALNRLVQNPVIIRFEPNANFVSNHLVPLRRFIPIQGHNRGVPVKDAPLLNFTLLLPLRSTLR
jgi:hypothetical protein